MLFATSLWRALRCPRPFCKANLGLSWRSSQYIQLSVYHLAYFLECLLLKTLFSCADN